MRKSFTLAFLLLSAFGFMSGVIDLNQLLNYAQQPIPAYITKDHTPAHNPITDQGATLGRVLFYDKQLSVNNSISCASCHLQEFAFTDTALVSRGVAGSTERHSMRLVNSRFSNEAHFFWDERALSLEDQVTHPLRDRMEMGFSGLANQPGIDSLFRKMEKLDYYQDLFSFVYGSPEVNEDRIQRALAQFIRSMQSFDSKYDAGRAQVGSDLDKFPNYTNFENEGKTLFMTLPTDGGAGCFRCHAPPEFSIDPNSLNNGVIDVIGDPTATDLQNTRAPSLRNLRNPNGVFNGPFMHSGKFSTLNEVLNHYNYQVDDPNNTNFDPRLAGPANDLTIGKFEKERVIAFLHTLNGTDIYTNEKWSDPFDANGQLTVLPLVSGTDAPSLASLCKVFPNPAVDHFFVQIPDMRYHLQVLDMSGKIIFTQLVEGTVRIDVSGKPKGIYTCVIRNEKGGMFSRKIAVS